jgi:hypothetical protein
MKTILLVSAFVTGVVSCTPSKPPTPPDNDAGTCTDACRVLQANRCPEGNATPKGETCEAFCYRTNEVSFLALPVACVARAKTIAELQMCGVCYGM